MTQPALPYFRLSGFYLLYFGTLGVLMPYWSLYLRELGFDGTQIGQLVAILLGTKIVAPYLWGMLADASGRLMPVIRAATLLALLCYAGVLATESFIGLALVMMAFSFFWNAALPQFEAVTLNHLGQRTEVYSRIRLWGSIGFIASVVGLGMALEHFSPLVLPWVALALFAALFALSTTVPESRQQATDSGTAPISRVLRRPEVIGFFVVFFLIQASHGPYYAFFTLHMEDLGYRRATIGQFWALGVVAEIVAFLLMPRLMARFGPRVLLLVALAATTLRWLVTALYADQAPVIVAAQTLHLFSFAMSHAVAMYYVHQFFIGRHQGRGQALYSALTFGAGGAFGSLGAGYLWAFGGNVLFFASALAAALGLLVAWWMIPADPRRVIEQRVYGPGPPS